MELFVQILFYVISNALPEVCARGQKETLDPLRSLCDLRSLPIIINTIEGAEKVAEGDDDDKPDNKDADISHV